MTTPGQGGLQPPPQNVAPAGAVALGVQPGVSSPVVRARQVIISGTGEGLWVYSGTPAAGNLIFSIQQAAGTDPTGLNPVPNGGAVAYNDQGFAAALEGGFISFYYGATWPAEQMTLVGQLSVSSAGILDLAVLTGLSGLLTVPQGAPTITTLGSTWNATTASECNANFTAITTALANAGIT